MEKFDPECRKDGSRHTKSHRDQIDSEGGRQELFRTQKSQPFHNGANTDRCASPRRWECGKHDGGRQRSTVRDDVNGVDSPQTEAADDETCQQGAGDDGHAGYEGLKGVHAGQIFCREDHRHDCQSCWEIQTLKGGGRGGGDEKHPQLGVRREGIEGKPTARSGKHHLCQDQNPPTIQRVRDGAPTQGPDQSRSELDQADKTYDQR